MSRSSFHSPWAEAQPSFPLLCKNENYRVEAAASAVGIRVALVFFPFPVHVVTTDRRSSVCIERAGGRLSSHSLSGCSLVANVSNKAKETFFQ